MLSTGSRLATVCLLRRLPMRRSLAALLLFSFFGFASTACGPTWDWSGNALNCRDPNDPSYKDPLCGDHDAGSDGSAEEGGSSSSSSGSSARCSGTCVPNAPDGFSAPQPVYVGLSKPWPPEDDCPANVGSFGDLRYTGLAIPSPGCPACICGPIEGSCSPTPEIVLNANLCNSAIVAVTNFSGPANWDGSCTMTNAVPADLECPPGSGIPCAQSIVTSPLPAPIDGCEPIPLPVPKATSDKPWWKNVVVSCSPTATAEGCVDQASHQCLPGLPSEPVWRYCVRRVTAGVYECPSASAFKTQVLAHLYDSYIDTRACTECTCVPSGGTCFGTLRVYKDDTCSTNELSSLMVSSDWPNCSNLVLPGEALSSKEITDLAYVPGICAPKGGEPVGDVEFVTTPEFEGHEPVFTWCCMPGAKAI